MGLGGIVGTILGSTSHPKTDKKHQADSGSILEGFWLPNEAHVGSILALKIDRKSRSMFDAIFDQLLERFCSILGVF